MKERSRSENTQRPFSWSEWLEQRALLNHDILCNQLRNELVALQGDPQSPDVVRLKMWLLRESEYRRFLDSTLNALSPAQLLESPHFARWAAEERVFFQLVFQELFCQTTGLGLRIEALQELLTKCVGEVGAFLEVAPVERTHDRIARLQSLLEALSLGISSLPTVIGGTAEAPGAC